MNNEELTNIGRIAEQRTGHIIGIILIVAIIVLVVLSWREVIDPLVASLAIVCAMSIGGMIVKDSGRAAIYDAKVQQAVENNYDFYLAGRKINPDTVHLDNYTLDIDTDKGIVIMERCQ